LCVYEGRSLFGVSLLGLFLSSGPKLANER
jgi:hypothetical protein